MTTLPLPPIVDRDTWFKQIEALRVKEKAVTRQLDELAAERRRLPMVEVTNFTVEGEEGKVKLSEIFQQSHQLAVYGHMWERGADWQCHGCGYFTSQFSPAIKALGKYDARFVVFVNAPYEEVRAYKEKIGYSVPMYSIFGSKYMEECADPTNNLFGLNVFLRDGDKVYRTWCTTHRGVEMAGYNHQLQDMLPYGRQEEWQDSPEGWPKSGASANWLTSKEIAGFLKGGTGE